MKLSCAIKDYKKIQEFIKFCVVGVVCIAIDSTVFYILHNWTGYRIAIVSGSACGLVFNYFANVLWSFKQETSIKNAVGIIVAFIVNIFIVRFSLMWLFINIAGLNEGVAFIPTLIISVITNFFFVRYIVYKY